MSTQDLESRLSALTKKREALEQKLKNFPVTVKQLRLFLELKTEHNLTSLKTIKTPTTYYSHPYEHRARILQAPNHNTYTLCKTIIMKNKKYREDLASDPFYPLFIGVIVQYETKLHSGKLSDLLKEYQNTHTQG